MDAKDAVVRCPGCGGRNPPGTSECEWCARPFGTQPGRRARWPLFVGVMLILVLMVALGLAALSLTTPDSETRRTLAGATATTTPSLATRTAAAARTALPRSRQAAIANTDGQGASLRREPSAQSERITGLPEETVVRIVGPEVLDDGNAWVEVQDADGNRGWIQSDLIRALDSATPGEIGAPILGTAVPSPTGGSAPASTTSQPAGPDNPSPTPG